MSKHFIYNEEKLRKRSMNVTHSEFNDIRGIFFDIHAKFTKYPNLCGISAPQIGVRKRLISLKFNTGEIKDFINPIITKASQYKLFREPYTSIDPTTKVKTTKEYIIPRATKLGVSFVNINEEEETFQLEGASAEIFQLCLDYLDGVLLPDLGLEVLSGFDDLNEKTKQDIINEYLDVYEQRLQEVEDYISKDEEIQSLFRKRKFLNEVQGGKIKVLTQTEWDELVAESTPKQSEE